MVERLREIRGLEDQRADTIQGALDVLYARDAVDPNCGRCDRLRDRILNVLMPDE